ncbi:MAG: PAS domain S-box protein [Brevinematales bacterium]
MKNELILYRKVFENLLNGIAYCKIIRDRKGRPSDFKYIMVNRAFETITGLENPAGKNVSELIPGIRETNPELLEIYSRCAETGKPETFETYIESLKIWFHILVSSPQKGYFTAIFENITERKKTEEIISRYELLEKNSKDLIFFIRKDDCRILEVNDAALKEYGYSRDEFLKLYLYDLRIESERDLNGAQMKEADLHGIVFETIHRRKDGTSFPVEVSIKGAGPGGNRILIDIVRNNTERRKAEEALQASEEKYRTLFEAMTEGFSLDEIIFDENGKPCDFRYLMVNPAFEYQTGFKADNIAGRTVLELDPEAGPAWFEKFGRVAISGEPAEFEEVFGPLGRWFHINVFPAGGNKFAAIYTNITQRKLFEDEIKRSNRDLEQFAYVASHDLQEPLRMVSSYTQLLSGHYRGKLDPEADEYMRFIIDGAKHMQGLINDLLAYARVNPHSMSITRVDSARIMEKVKTNCSVILEETGCNIEFENMPVVSYDPTQLYQLFQNFLSNALKFHGKEKPRVRFSAVHKNSEWVFSITDNGIGIDPKFFDKIFVIFKRLHTREEYDGTGIGLAICKKIIEGHGGRIWVESSAGKGSTFYFTIPDNLEAISGKVCS